MATAAVEEHVPPFPEAPAPWHCEGESFWLCTYLRPSKDEPYPLPSAFSELEGTSAFADPNVTGKFEGGLAVVMIVRYKVSPVGRKNWNIPKQVAHFEFTPNPDAKDPTILPYSKVSVASVEDPSKPFFIVNFKSTRFLSKAHIPFNTDHVPGLDMTFLHPPLPESPIWGNDARVGTKRWWSLKPLMTGKAGLMWITGGFEGGKLGDDIGFPNVHVWKCRT